MLLTCRLVLALGTTWDDEFMTFSAVRWRQLGRPLRRSHNRQKKCRMGFLATGAAGAQAPVLVSRGRRKKS
jgi:hypothetical protein